MTPFWYYNFSLIIMIISKGPCSPTMPCGPRWFSRKGKVWQVAKVMHLSSAPNRFHNFVCEPFSRYIIAPKHQKTSQALGEHRPQSSENKSTELIIIMLHTWLHQHWHGEKESERERNQQTNNRQDLIRHARTTFWDRWPVPDSRSVRTSENRERAVKRRTSKKRFLATLTHSPLNRPCRSRSFLPFVTSSVLTVKDNFLR